MTIREAEKRLGVRIAGLGAVNFAKMLAGGADTDKKMVDGIKEMVYARLVEYIDIEGYPTEASPDFKEANVSDLVLYTIGPVIAAVRKMGRKICLRREKEMISVDGVMGGNEEFVVVDEIALAEDKAVLVIEAKRTSTGQAMKQIMLSLKDARDNNQAGTVYGFVTTGQHWKMLSYDGASFLTTPEFMAVFEGMEEEKESWMKECSVVDCLVVALTTGGTVKDVVAGGSY